MGDGRIRYVAREVILGPRSVAWRVYDRDRGSWPVLLPALALRVPQRFDTEEEAQAWADEHLNGIAPVVPVASPAARRATRKRAS